jgi:serine/threonine protein kinase
MVMGTPFYMSPEQARGDRNLDARVDLWACGVILYEALTGRRPFVANNYNALLLQILTASPRPARELRPTLSPGFDRILDRSLARAREDRYQTALDFQRDLHKLRLAHFDATKPPPMAAVLGRVGPMSRQPPSAPRSGQPGSHPVPSPRVQSQPHGPPSPPVRQESASHKQPTPPPQPRARRDKSPISSSDPLARLPSLEARYDDEGNDTSGTHIALDLLDSGEMDTDAGPPPEIASDFDDDMPTEVVHTDWDDETTRHPLEAAASMLRNAKKPKTRSGPIPSIEDTVKIEGPIEEHFARVDPESRKPRPRRPR